MLEIDDVILILEGVSRTSRHTHKFTDWMRKDHKKDECLIANDLVR